MPNHMQSLKEKRLEEFKERYKTPEWAEGFPLIAPFEELISDILEFHSDSIDMAYEEGLKDGRSLEIPDYDVRDVI